MRRTLEHSIPVESGFSDLNHAAFASQFETGACDFNDMVINALCVSRSFFLVTHDSDFKEEYVSILTANKKLL
jgi:predicted nuclease of predicted toxin-antitoxin system